MSSPCSAEHCADSSADTRSFGIFRNLRRRQILKFSSLIFILRKNIILRKTVFWAASLIAILASNWPQIYCKSGCLGRNKYCMNNEKTRSRNAKLKLKKRRRQRLALELAWDNFVDWFESSSALPSPNNRWFIVFSFWELDFSINEFEKTFLMLFVYWSFLVWDSAFESENRRAAFFEQESNFGFIFEGKNGRRRVCGTECAGTCSAILFSFACFRFVAKISHQSLNLFF